jgi:hypothetical protein
MKIETEQEHDLISRAFLSLVVAMPSVDEKDKAFIQEIVHLFSDSLKQYTPTEGVQ